MVASAPALADLFLGGAHGVVLEELRFAPEELAHEVARLVGTGLRDDAMEYWNVCPRERTWVDHDAALLALARLPGVDQPELAAALTDAVTWQVINGTGSPLEPEVFAWMMEWAPDSVYEGCEQQTSIGHRFLEAALWAHPGERAIAWMVDRYRTDPIGARFDYAPFHELAPEDFMINRAGHAVVDAGELGSIVMFTVGPQHQLCRTWVGYAEDGRIVRVLSDLGLIHLNPELHPTDPMRPGPPWDESVGPFPPRESDRLAGVISNTQWAPASRAGLDEGTVTVLEVLAAEHNWLRTLAVWYRWDDSRAGNLLPAEEFKRRFESL